MSVVRPLAVSVLAFAAAFFFRFSVLDAQSVRRRAEPVGDDVFRSPSPAVLHAVTLEHRHAWADVTWLQLVQELARPLAGQAASWERVRRWSEVATDLDPRYLVVYNATAVHLSAYARQPDVSDAVAEKGLTEMPWAWRLAMLVGYNAYFLKGDPQRSAQFFARACHAPPAPPEQRYTGPPRYMCALAANVQAQAGDRRGAIEMLELMLPTMSDGDPMREDAEYRLLTMRSEARLELFDEACERYLAELGQLPPDGDTLVQRGYLRAPPFDEFGSPIVFDPDDGCIAKTERIKVREREAVKNLGSHVNTSTTATSSVSTSTGAATP